MSQPPPPPFSLARATPRDARLLAAIAARAFTRDDNTRVKAAMRPPGAFADGMAAGYAAWLAAPAPARCAVLKAIDGATGRVLGSVCWGFRGVDVADHLPPAVDTPPQPAEAEAEPPAGDREGPGATAEERAAALEKVTGAHLAAFQERVMPDGAPCLYVVAVAVDPDAQGRGVGAALLRWGVDRADAAGALCWVHASEAGARVFAKLGFEEVDRLTVDLDEWAVAPPEDEGREEWGEYVFRAMVRQPWKRSE